MDQCWVVQVRSGEPKLRPRWQWCCSIHKLVLCTQLAPNHRHKGRVGEKKMREKTYLRDHYPPKRVGYWRIHAHDIKVNWAIGQSLNFNFQVLPLRRTFIGWKYPHKVIGRTFLNLAKFHEWSSSGKCPGKSLLDTSVTRSASTPTSLRSSKVWAGIVLGGESRQKFWDCRTEISHGHKRCCLQFLAVSVATHHRVYISQEIGYVS